MDREVKSSPDSGVLYFLSERDGFRCIWAERLDPKNQAVRPASRSRFIISTIRNSPLTSLGSPGKVGLSVTSDGLLFSLAETTGNIWMARHGSRVARKDALLCSEVKSSFHGLRLPTKVDEDAWRTPRVLVCRFSCEHR